MHAARIHLDGPGLQQHHFPSLLGGRRVVGKKKVISESCIRSGKLPLPPPPGPIIGPIIYPIIYPIISPTIIWWVVRPWWAGQGANKKWRPGGGGGAIFCWPPGRPTMAGPPTILLLGILLDQKTCPGLAVQVYRAPKYGFPTTIPCYLCICY